MNLPLFFSLLEALFFLSLLPSLVFKQAFLFLWGTLFILDSLLYSSAHLRLRLSHFSYLFHLSSFKSSLKLSLRPFFSLFCLTFFTFLFSPFLKNLSFDPYLLLSYLSFFFLEKKGEKEKLDVISILRKDLFEKAKRLFSPKTSRNLFPFKEKSAFLSYKYPLLRKTKTFLGEKHLFLDLENKKPHVIFLHLESFRAKNVGCLGAKIGLSPHFDQLAKQGILFSNFHSTGNLTCRATIASLFGIYPPHLDWPLLRYIDIPLIGAPQLLQKIGYQTALIQAGHLCFENAFEFYQNHGFETILGKSDLEKEGAFANSWGVHDEYLMEFSANWLAKQEKPTFLTLFTITNHHPWSKPKNWEAPLKAKNNPYFETFSYTDESLSLFIKTLKKKNLLENTLLFIFGDHGQEEPTKGLSYKGNQKLSQETLHVPLLIYGKGVKKPKTIDQVASQADLLPTLIDLFQIPYPHHCLGKSLLRKTSSPIFFSHPSTSSLMGCRDQEFKAVFSSTQAALYDLSKDPEETKDLSKEFPEKLSLLKEKTKLFYENLQPFYENRSFSLKTEKSLPSYHLEFVNSLTVRDDLLEEEGKKNSHILSCLIKGCLFISDEGMKKFLKNTPHLEVLIIEDLDEILGESWPHLPHLARLELTNCKRLSSSITPWIKNLSNLRDLKIEAPHFKDQDFFELSKSQRLLWSLEILSSPIQGEGLKTLVDENPELVSLRIERCSSIKPEILSYLKTKPIKINNF